MVACDRFKRQVLAKKYARGGGARGASSRQRKGKERCVRVRIASSSSENDGETEKRKKKQPESKDGKTETLVLNVLYFDGEARKQEREVFDDTALSFSSISL